MTKQCKLPGCDNPVGQEETDSTYRTSRFCSVRCDVKYDHLKADAEDARRAEKEWADTHTGKECN